MSRQDTRLQTTLQWLKDLENPPEIVQQYHESIPADGKQRFLQVREYRRIVMTVLATLTYETLADHLRTLLHKEPGSEQLRRALFPPEKAMQSRINWLKNHSRYRIIESDIHNRFLATTTLRTEEVERTLFTNRPPGLSTVLEHYTMAQRQNQEEEVLRWWCGWIDAGKRRVALCSQQDHDDKHQSVAQGFAADPHSKLPLLDANARTLLHTLLDAGLIARPTTVLANSQTLGVLASAHGMQGGNEARALIGNHVSPGEKISLERIRNNLQPRFTFTGPRLVPRQEFRQLWENWIKAPGACPAGQLTLHSASVNETLDLIAHQTSGPPPDHSKGHRPAEIQVAYGALLARELPGFYLR